MCQVFYKIPFTGELCSEVSQVIIAAAIVIVLSLAWWTTNIRENWHVRTVYFFDARLRRSRNLQRLTNHTVSSTLVESTHPSPDSTSAENEAAGVSVDSVGNTEQNKPLQSNLSDDSGLSARAGCSSQEDEQTRIIQVMDTDADVLRQRRIAFFEGRRDTLISPSDESSMPIDDQESDAMSESPVMEHNYADRNDIVEENNGSIDIVEEQDKNDIVEEQNVSNDSQENNQNNIRIKLKFINDDLKLVDGRPEELLGDFKQRHFQLELSTNKLVKLIFNGQVLQRDNDTLQNYGLFDNCVVHCLIHQHRVNPNDESGNASSNSANHNGRTNGGNTRDWDLGNLLIGLISFILSSAWYFRYQYPQLFTVTATIALVAITGIFTIVSVGMYFPDPDPVRPQAHILR